MFDVGTLPEVTEGAPPEVPTEAVANVVTLEWRRQLEAGQRALLDGELDAAEAAFRRAVAEGPAFADAHFDLAFSVEAVYYAVDLDVALREVHRVLKDDGRFFLCDFCSPHPLTIIPMYLMMV